MSCATFRLSLILLLSLTSPIFGQDGEEAATPEPPESESSASESSSSESSASEPSEPEPLPEGLELFAASPFVGGTVIEAHTLRGLSGEVAIMIMNSEQGGDFAFETFVAPLQRLDEGKVYVPVFVEIDGATFLEKNQAETARVEVYAYALGPDKSVHGYFAEAFAVQVGKLGEAIWQRGLKYYGHLELPPGSFEIRVLVRNYQSKAAALRQLELTVPSKADFRGPLLLTPVFAPPEDREAWLPVTERGEGLLETDYPFVIDNQPLSPMSLPVLTAQRPVRAHLQAYGLPSGSLDGRVELRAEDGSVESVPMRVAERHPAEDEGPEALTVEFQMPKIAPGSYTLRAEVSVRKKAAISSPLTVAVLPAGTRERSLIWTDLRGQIVTTAPDTSASSVAETAKGRRLEARTQRREDRRRELARKERLGALASRYLDVLSKYGRENAAAVRTALFELESEVLTETDGSSRALQEAQVQVAEQMAAKDVEALIPLLVLHEDLYLTYRQRRLYSLTASSRSLIENVAAIYAERGGTQGSGVVAGRALASLGGYLQEANLPASSREMFLRALEYDPLSATAMLGLATSYERYGEYSKAVDVLEKLLVAHPELAECHLRLAVDLKRLGVRARAVELLERALDLEAPAWIHSLVRQELARSLIETSALERAAEILEAGLETDSEQSARALLAHIYDRMRRPYDALALFEGIVPGATGSSARKAYDSWPEEALMAVREELSAAAVQRRDLIHELLNTTPEAGE